MGTFFLVLLLIVCVGGVVLFLAAQSNAQKAERDERDAAHKARWADLTARFGAENAQRIQFRQLWQGAPVDAVYEMHGRPSDVDEDVNEKRTRLTLKYQPLARKGSFGLRVTVDDGIVTGWKTAGS